MPDYTILIAYLFGVATVMYGFKLIQKPTIYVKAVILLVGYLFAQAILCSVKREGFQATTGTTTGDNRPICPECGTKSPCPDHKDTVAAICPPMPDMSKYVLKTSIPPCPSMPDLDNYMLKTECPPVPDMAQYVLKSSIPKQGPIIIDTSADNKAKCGECPPCPRPRCPDVKCPPPTVCPAAPPCPRPVCPQQVVKCKAEEANRTPVRPFLAPLSSMGFGGSA